MSILKINRVYILLLVALLGFFIFFILSKFIGNNYSRQIFPAVISQNKVLSKLPMCTDHNSDVWHPPFQKDSSGKIICVYGHEHGDEPPSWVSQAGFKIGFDSMAGFMGNTSDMENNLKHPGMKGFSTNIKGVEVYARIHLASNVLDRSSRYHSYELFLKDQSGGISHFQGWLNSGDPDLDRIAYQDKSLGEAGIDPGRRPIVWAASRHACLVDKTWCIELWSMTTSGWGPEIAWGINDATTFFDSREKYDVDLLNWDKSGSLGGDRSISLTIYRNADSLKKREVNQIPVGQIWATQFGDIVSGPDDPICKGESFKFGMSYKNICLENIISATLPQITGVGNTVQKRFDTSGVVLPN